MKHCMVIFWKVVFPLRLINVQFLNWHKLALCVHLCLCTCLCVCARLCAHVEARSQRWLSPSIPLPLFCLVLSHFEDLEPGIHQFNQCLWASPRGLTSTSQTHAHCQACNLWVHWMQHTSTHTNTYNLTQLFCNLPPAHYSLRSLCQCFKRLF